MRDEAYSLLTAFMVIFLIITGVMTYLIFQDIDRTTQTTDSRGKDDYSVNINSQYSPQTEDLQMLSPPFPLVSIHTNRSSDSDIIGEQQASDSDKPEFDQNYDKRLDFNDALIYNGVISTMSVNPKMVTYDYNNDGIADFKKTVLVVNII